ncbi:hypothetical protein PanWU01x14_368280 [Parasponia andersonii]|uniref:Uncharacterized protein n=1 Tax=Parasponia andersonii TaxID=3476 RepID=A0A2P5A526_PARAD|nr:hypothetical protein PanWU01x14_368280 [Parasponia andersonii]
MILRELSKKKPTPSVSPRFDIGQSRSDFAKILPPARFSDYESVVRYPFSTPLTSGVSSRRRRPALTRRELSKKKSTPSVSPRFDIGQSRSDFAKILPPARFSDYESVVRSPFSTPLASGVSSRRRRPALNSCSSKFLFDKFLPFLPTM